MAQEAQKDMVLISGPATASVPATSSRASAGSLCREGEVKAGCRHDGAEELGDTGALSQAPQACEIAPMAGSAVRVRQQVAHQTDCCQVLEGDPGTREGGRSQTTSRPHEITGTRAGGQAQRFSEPPLPSGTL